MPVSRGEGAVRVPVSQQQPPWRFLCRLRVELAEPPGQQSSASWCLRMRSDSQTSLPSVAGVQVWPQLWVQELEYTSIRQRGL